MSINDIMIKAENERLLSGEGIIKCMALDPHIAHIYSHRELLIDNNDPEAVKRILDHIDEHFTVWQEADEKINGDQQMKVGDKVRFINKKCNPRYNNILGKIGVVTHLYKNKFIVDYLSHQIHHTYVAEGCDWESVESVAVEPKKIKHGWMHEQMGY